MVVGLTVLLNLCQGPGGVNYLDTAWHIRLRTAVIEPSRETLIELYGTAQKADEARDPKTLPPVPGVRPPGGCCPGDN